MKKVYWISLYIKIDNQENLKKYAETVTPIIKGFGGKPLVRGGKYETLMVTILWEQSFGSSQVMKKQLSVITPLNIKMVGTLPKTQQ